MKVFVVYGAVSKIIRRVIVTDEFDTYTPADNKEAVLEIPHADYLQMDLDAFNSHVAKQVGDPLHSGRCVEVDATGAVVAVFKGDPLIDKPTKHPLNTIEKHDEATVGDRKVAGEFPAKVPRVLVPDPDRKPLP